jgi:uncharacterized protein YqhQ
MFGLCKYKDILGVPNKGIHSYRLFGVAIVDVIMTFVGALLISYISGYKYVYTLVSFFILGIILHQIFCVRTTIDKAVFT